MDMVDLNGIEYLGDNLLAFYTDPLGIITATFLESGYTLSLKPDADIETRCAFVAFCYAII